MQNSFKRCVIACTLGLKVLFLVSCSVLDQGNYRGNPEIARSLVDKGVRHLRNRQISAADAAFRIALESANSVNSDLPIEEAAIEAIDGIGCVALVRGELSLAETLFQRAIELDSQYSPAYGHLAMVYELQGKDTESYRLFERSLKRDPNNYKIRANYAAFLFDKGRKREALSLMQEALELSKNEPIITENINFMTKIGVEGGHQKKQP
jgi:tetratricopeptide (TPR) repeat protein